MNVTWLIRPLLCLAALAPLSAGATARAEAVAETRPAGAEAPPRDETPVQALVRGWRVCDQCDAGKAMELYSYGRRERALIEAMCTAAAEGTKVELAMRRRFGRDVADEMVHAIGQSVEADVVQGQATVEGDTATVLIPNSGHTITMARVGGVWKIAVDAQTAFMTDAAIEASVAMHLAEAARFRKVAARLEAGELKTAQDVADAMVEASRPTPPPPGGGPV